MHPRPSKHAKERGQSAVEFALCSVLLIMTLFGVVEFSRMALVYTSVCNGARMGVRYAMVHGSDNPASTNQIKGVVDNFLTGVNTANLTVGVTYPDTVSGTACHDPGCHVKVTVSYPYDPMFSYFTLSVTLGSTSEGVITF